jgi:carbonic anhydrase
VSDATLARLLERNARHERSLSPDHFDAVQTGQEPAVVSVCCSDSRVSQEGMWGVTEPGWLFTPSTLGNQAWDRVDGEWVVDGSVLYPLVRTGTETAVVVGHTGCGAVTAALAAHRGETDPAALPPGVRTWVEALRPVVADALADDRVDPEAPRLVEQLVEYNVDRQVAFLRASDDVPDDVDVFGFVYDFQRVYGDASGRAYLVNAGGETDVTTLRARVPDGFAAHVARLV